MSGILAHMEHLYQRGFWSKISRNVTCMVFIVVGTTHHCPSFFFFYDDPDTSLIYTISLHDALPIYGRVYNRVGQVAGWTLGDLRGDQARGSCSGNTHQSCGAHVCSAARVLTL